MATTSTQAAGGSTSGAEGRRSGDDSVTPEALALVSRLIAHPTVSRDSNLDLIHDVRDYLAGLGIPSELTFDDEGRKANLFATAGPADLPGVVLSGHTDVVPVDGQDWATDPFSAVERDGRMYGRGSCDMKGFLGLCLALLPSALERGLARPLHLAFSYDEELGCLGVRRLIARLGDRPVLPRLCIVGEPTRMRPVIAHKGKLSLRCHVHGLECHSALAPRGVNAVEHAAELIVHLRGMAERRRRHGPFDHAFDPPFTTIHTGTVRGGTALNIVPRDCSFEFEFRYLPAERPDALLAEIEGRAAELLPGMRAVHDRAGIAFEEIAAFPGLDMADDDPATELVRSLAGGAAAAKVSFGTEAGLFQQAGIPTVVCGPGDIAQAHRPDEYVELVQLGACQRFLGRLVERMCG